MIFLSFEEVICQKLVLRVSSGVPNTEKQMKARRRRRSVFIVSRCLEPLMKHEARVFDMTSQPYLTKVSAFRAKWPNTPDLIPGSFA